MIGGKGIPHKNKAVFMEKKYRVHLMICAGTSCVLNGSLDMRDALVEEIHKRGLQD